VINKFLITEKKRGEQFVVPLFLFYLSPFGFKSAKVRKRPLRYLCTFPCRFVSTAATWHLAPGRNKSGHYPTKPYNYYKGEII